MHRNLVWDLFLVFYISPAVFNDLSDDESEILDDNNKGFT